MILFLSYGMEAFIGSDRKKISRANLAAFPPFLRFTEVRLRYDTGYQSLFTKCRLFEDCLKSIKSALKDPIKICFVAYINRDDRSDFSDHSSVAIYLHYGLLPICDSSRCYEFNIDFDFDLDEYEPDGFASMDLIYSILQISQVQSCSNVSIELSGNSTSTFLPVEEILDWLAQKTADCVEIYDTKEQNRFLWIKSLCIPNIQEMWDHLKEVS